jgi:hypothetical protein
VITFDTRELYMLLPGRCNVGLFYFVVYSTMLSVSVILLC